MQFTVTITWPLVVGLLALAYVPLSYVLTEGVWRVYDRDFDLRDYCGAAGSTCRRWMWILSPVTAPIVCLPVLLLLGLLGAALLVLAETGLLIGSAIDSYSGGWRQFVQDYWLVALAIGTIPFACWLAAACTRQRKKDSQ